MLWSPRALPCSLIAFARCCPGPGSPCAVCLIAAWVSLNTAIDATPCARSNSHLATDFWSATLIPLILASHTAIPSVRMYLQKTVKPSLFEHTATALTLSLSVWNPSVHHVQVANPALLSFLLSYSSAALLAVASSSSIVVLTAGSSPGSGQHIVSAVLPHACSNPATLPTGGWGVGSW